MVSGECVWHDMSIHIACMVSLCNLYVLHICKYVYDIYIHDIYCVEIVCGM